MQTEDPKLSLWRSSACIGNEEAHCSLHPVSTEANKSTFPNPFRYTVASCTILSQMPSAVPRVHRACEESYSRRKGHVPANSVMWIGPWRVRSPRDRMVVACMSSLLLPRHPCSRWARRQIPEKSSRIQSTNQRADRTRDADCDQEISSER